MVIERGRKGKRAFASAYSGFVYSMPIEGKMVFVLAYSGVDYTKPLVGGVLPDGTQRTREG